MVTSRRTAHFMWNINILTIKLLQRTSTTRELWQDSWAKLVDVDGECSKSNGEQESWAILQSLSSAIAMAYYTVSHSS